MLIDNPILQCLDYCGAGLNNKSMIFDSYNWLTNGLNIASNK